MNSRFKRIIIEDLQEGMVLAENIFDCDENVLLSEGIVLREAYIKKIKDMHIESTIVLDEENTTIVIKSEDDLNKSNELIIQETRQDAKLFIEESMENILKTSSLDYEKLHLIVNQIIDEIFESQDITISLANLKAVDDYIFHHSVNVCILSIITGIYMGLNKNKLLELAIGAILHDIGKTLVPRDILNKPSKLNYDEFEVIKEHSILGYNVISNIKNISVQSADVILSHHERYDGFGYPNGKSNDDIHMFAKIASVADVFDAVTSDRIYGRKEDSYIAISYIIEESGSKFDPEIVKTFLKVTAYYPIGLNVILDTGEYGVIVKKNRDRPLIRVLFDKNMNSIKGYYEIDLSKNPMVKIADIDPKKLKFNLYNNDEITN